LLETVKARRN